MIEIAMFFVSGIPSWLEIAMKVVCSIFVFLCVLHVDCGLHGGLFRDSSLNEIDLNDGVL